jgi:hypothetical protein
LNRLRSGPAFKIHQNRTIEPELSGEIKIQIRKIVDRTRPVDQRGVAIARMPLGAETQRQGSLATLRQKGMTQLALEELEERILLRSDLSQDQVVETGVDILADRLQVSLR